MEMVQLEAMRQTSGDRPAFLNQPERSRNFADTLASMQDTLNGDEQLSTAQARMVIRMVGAAISGDFQQVSGWSGEEAQNFFSRFNLLSSFSAEQGSSPYSAGGTPRAQQVSRAYEEMASPPASVPSPEPGHAAQAYDTAVNSRAGAALHLSHTSNDIRSQGNSSPAPTDIHKLIDNVAQQMDLPAKLVHSVVFAESSYRPDAVSPAGAEGLMQLMPTTAQEVGVKNSFDPQDNLTGGCRYLKGLLEKYHGDLDHALAAYNWGQGNVDRRGLEQMPLETRNYIARVKQGLEGQV
ncbi:MAG: lytic transglycosylase domain-containing protein [Thermodesulfobacteriota bacterium]